MMNAVDSPKGLLMADKQPIDGFLSRVPPPDEIRRRIAENLKERQILRQVLKLSQQRYGAAANSREVAR
jgi:hypothetical protein